MHIPEGASEGNGVLDQGGNAQSRPPAQHPAPTSLIKVLSQDKLNSRSRHSLGGSSWGRG